MKIAISLPLLLAGVLLLATNGWFESQHTVGWIFIGAWFLRWAFLFTLMWIATSDPYPLSGISTPRTRKRAKRRRARFDRRRRRRERWRSFKDFITKKDIRSNH